MTGPHAAGVPTDDDEPRGARRAARSARTSAIELRKGIPHGRRPRRRFGRRGRGARRARPTSPVSHVHFLDVERIAATLGADVPFCLRSSGAMRVRGIGEDLSRVTLPELAVVIVTPPFGCATADVYRAWDALGGPAGATVEIDGLPPLRNDLEPAAHHVEPRLAAFKAAVERGGRRARAAGGQRLVVRGRRRAACAGAEAARARIAAAVEGQITVGLTVDAGVRRRP